MKNQVQQDKNSDVKQLKALMTGDVIINPQSMLQNTWTKVEYRLDICRANRGSQTGIY